MKSKFDEALTLFQNGQLNKAKDICLEIIKIQPNNFDILHLLGLIAFQTKNYLKSVEIINKAIQIKPDYAEIYDFRAIVLIHLKKFEEAVESWNHAIKIKPDYAEAHYNRGNALVELNKIDAAIESFDRAIKIKPDYEEAYKNRGNALLELHKIDAAIESFDRAIQIKPDSDYLFGQLFHTKNSVCNWDFFKEDLEKLKNKTLKVQKISPPFPILSVYDSPSLQKISAEIFLKKKYSSTDFLEPITKRELNNKIRIGYYSADFCNHAVSHLLVKLFELHDKSKFELFGFSFGPEKNDEMHKRVSSAFDQFINVNLKNDKEIALLSRDLKIDIAVDLMGFTKNNRFGIFVERCAPIQVNYLGYSATTGADCIDYIIGDKIVIPKENQKDYSEKIIYLPDCFMANDFTKKISTKIFTREELGLPKEGFVFCCFNKYYKITPSIFDIWMRLLKKVEGSVLWLTGDNFTGAKNLQKEANQRGVDSNRLIFSKAMPLLADHLARHKSADLFIDTIPYNGHTRASDALWSGLPVLALVGQSFASRVSASLLNAVGLQELITYSEKEYEDLSVELATNPTRLKEIKSKLEKNKLIKPLFNTKLFTKNIESAYTKIYEKYLKNLSVENIEIK